MYFSRIINARDLPPQPTEPLLAPSYPNNPWHSCSPCFLQGAPAPWGCLTVSPSPYPGLICYQRENKDNRLSVPATVTRGGTHSPTNMGCDSPRYQRGLHLDAGNFICRKVPSSLLCNGERVFQHEEFCFASSQGRTLVPVHTTSLMTEIYIPPASSLLSPRGNKLSPSILLCS